MNTTSLIPKETQQHLLSNGRLIDLPIRYSNTTGMVAHFPAPTKSIKRLLPTPKLTPVSFFPGTSVLSIAALQYREVSDFDPYDEVAIMIPVQYEPRINVPGLPLLFHNRFKTFGFYVLHLPVTTTQSKELGIELWGYPKFVASIEFEETSDARRCKLSGEGQLILDFSVKKRRIGNVSKSYQTYTILDGKLVRTKIETQEQSCTRRLSGGADIKLGDHAIAQSLADTKFRPSAIEYSYASSANSMLHPFSESFEL